MTYNVFSGTLNPTQSVTLHQDWLHWPLPDRFFWHICFWF